MSRVVIVEDDCVDKEFTKNEQSHYKGIFSKRCKFPSPDKEFSWASSQSKRCKKCNLVMPLTSFGLNTSGKDPFDRHGYRLRRGECESCNKKIMKGKSKAKKTALELGIPYKAPEGTSCELCNKIGRIVFDHHHEKDIFRGWLCNECNRSIGMLGENVEQMVKIINYLNKTEKVPLTFNNGVLEIIPLSQ